MTTNTLLKIAGASLVGILVLGVLLAFISPMATMQNNTPNNMNMGGMSMQQHHHMGGMM